MPTKPPRLIVLSDLWGKDKNHWLAHYRDFLSIHFEWNYYEATELANLNTPNLSQEERHDFFVQQGIQTAISNLLRAEPHPIYVLAFSIGGTIAWKAALKGANILGLYAISATRLRYETTNLAFPVKLLYGEKDPYRPENQWFQNKNMEWQILPGEAHEVYTQAAFINQFKEDILHFFQSSHGKK